MGLKDSPHPLLRDFELTVDRGEVVGLVGESGSGKTMASLAMMGLLPKGVELRGASVRLDGREMYDAEASLIRRTAREFTMIFQNPRAALNPTMRVGKQIARVLDIVQGVGRGKAARQAVGMLGDVGIPGADKVARAFPHQLSGGMCQRVMIAMALACRPQVLIADEPTTALDVTIQAQIFDLINELAAETSAGVVFITHDLGAVAEMSDRVVVLYRGSGDGDRTHHRSLRQPAAPLHRVPVRRPSNETWTHASKEVGADHSLTGCRFAHRCQYAFARCDVLPAPGRGGLPSTAACFLHVEGRVGTA